MKSFTHLVEWSLFFEVSVGVCPQHARYDEELRVLKIPKLVCRAKELLN